MATQSVWQSDIIVVHNPDVITGDSSHAKIQRRGLAPILRFQIFDSLKKRLQRGPGIVGRSIIDDYHLCRRKSLGKDTLKRFSNESLAIVGREQNRDPWDRQRELAFW